jgi:hypothetical protein
MAFDLDSLVNAVVGRVSGGAAGGGGGKTFNIDSLAGGGEGDSGDELVKYAKAPLPWLVSTNHQQLQRDHDTAMAVAYADAEQRAQSQDDKNTAVAVACADDEKRVQFNRDRAMAKLVAHGDVQSPEQARRPGRWQLQQHADRRTSTAPTVVYVCMIQ